MKCLVLGANGFVGSEIVDTLTAQGHNVIAFDRFSRGAQYLPHPNIQQVKGDFFNDSALDDALQSADYVIHSFSLTNPSTADNDPYSDIDLTIKRNVQLFEKMIRHNIKKVGYISSGGAVYGAIAPGSIVTEDAPTNPVSPYGIGKLATERYLAYFHRKYNLDYTAYRLTNPYGPRQINKQNQGVIPTFSAKIRNNEPITLLGDGTSSRDYIFIKDAAAMIVKSFFEASLHDTYNIGSGVQTELMTIVKNLQSLFEKKALIQYVDPPKTFLHRTDVSIERYVRDFGDPRLHSLEEGLWLTFPTSND